ncbi:hypothetical protein U9M48_020082 [Paspalum notatum var. saurae]|uniref:Uncharacterized protein n=1 Tax=Paspalum notatum var. saurae TaxID=547442 RepID=A0AAQ3TDI5_PASNO
MKKTGDVEVDRDGAAPLLKARRGGDAVQRPPRIVDGAVLKRRPRPRCHRARRAAPPDSGRRGAVAEAYAVRERPAGRRQDSWRRAAGDDGRAAAGGNAPAVGDDRQAALGVDELTAGTKGPLDGGTSIMGASAAVLSVAGVVTTMVSRLARISLMDAWSSAQGSDRQTASIGVLDDGATKMESSLAKTAMG